MNFGDDESSGVCGLFAVARPAADEDLLGDAQFVVAVVKRSVAVDLLAAVVDEGNTWEVVAAVLEVSRTGCLGFGHRCDVLVYHFLVDFVMAQGLHWNRTRCCDGNVGRVLRSQTPFYDAYQIFNIKKYLIK